MRFPEFSWLTPDQVRLLDRFAELLRKVAQPAGLIGFDSTYIEAEIARSLLLLDLGRPRHLVDVGSGAGFPGVPLAIALGGATLIEPRRRAVAFLELVARELDLALQILPFRAQEATLGELRESADAVVARAVAPLEASAELCSPLCRVGGMVVVTADPAQEAMEIRVPLLKELGLAPPVTKTLISSTGPLAIRQRVHIMSKTHPTSPKFPRRPRRASREG